MRLFKKLKKAYSNWKYHKFSSDKRFAYNVKLMLAENES